VYLQVSPALSPIWIIQQKCMSLQVSLWMKFVHHKTHCRTFLLTRNKKAQ